MSRTYKDSQHKKGARRERWLSVRAIRRDPPDLKKLSQALVQLALEQAAEEAVRQPKAVDGDGNGQESARE